VIDGVLSKLVSNVELPNLLSHLAGIQIDRVQLVGAGVRIDAHPVAVSAACPVCGQRSTRVHSRYQRRLSDFSIGGREVLIRVTVRRFFCAASACSRKIFTERLEQVTTVYGRRTMLAAQLLESVGLALGGQVPASQRPSPCRSTAPP